LLLPPPPPPSRAQGSLKNTLKSAWADATRRIERIDNFPQRLAERRSTLGVNAADAALPAAAAAAVRRVDNQRVLEGYLVLEEMLIEMKSVLLSRRLLDNVSRGHSQMLPTPNKSSSAAAVPAASASA
jgi:hypothetical protein